MENVTIVAKRLKGEIKIPPSKSLLHRAIICGGLSKGTSVIENVDYSDDIVATIDGMKALGAEIICKDKSIKINGKNVFSNRECTINCNESGSTLRFLIPVSIVKNGRIKYVFKESLGKRPLNTYFDIFTKQGINYEAKDNTSLTISGNIKNDNFIISGNISSQFISGLLFSLPLLQEDSNIFINTTLESKGYVYLTLDTMKKFGVTVEDKENNFTIRGGQTYKATNYKVEGDYSQAAFFFTANFLGSDINCNNLNIHSLQGDKICINILRQLGSKDEVVIDGSQCPDIVPILAVAASLRDGVTKIINCGRLRLKESNRLVAICRELKKLGANININDESNGLIIKGVKNLKGGKVSSHNDHRIAMSLVIASTCCTGEVIIENPNCVRKSYPNFWSHFKELGGEVR